MNYQPKPPHLNMALESAIKCVSDDGDAWRHFDRTNLKLVLEAARQHLVAQTPPGSEIEKSHECGFCGNKNSKMLISGPICLICDDCVWLCCKEIENGWKELALKTGVDKSKDNSHG